jgi:tropomyosin
MDKIKEVYSELSPVLLGLQSLPPPSQKLAALRTEADVAIDRAEAAEAKNKKYEQELLQKDQEITSLNHRLTLLDSELGDSEAKAVKYKADLDEAERGKATNESLTRKIELLEEELDAAEKNVKETVEKCVPFSVPVLVVPHLGRRLRQVDVKAEHYERQLQRVEQERDEWTKKYEVCVNVHPSHHPALLTVYPAHRTCKNDTAHRKRSSTSWLRTWRVSNQSYYFHQFASLYHHALYTAQA